MADLKLFLFGPPRVELDSAPVDFERRKALALLIFLAVSGQPHSRDTLATLFWPDQSQRQARAYLRRDLAILNTNLAGEWLSVDRELVELKREPEPWVDSLQFERRLAECRRHSHPPEAICPECLPLLTEAAALYTGDFLAGFTLRDSAEFDDWQFFQAEHLRHALASALERLVQSYSSQGNYKAAIPYARRWLALDPLHEPAQRQLMSMYDVAGQPSAALRQYEEYVRLLEEELGLPPEEETTTLYEAIKAKRLFGSFLKAEAQARKAGAGAPAQASPSFSHDLTSVEIERPLFVAWEQLSLFIGREKELAELRLLLAEEPACRLLTLVGPGGIGKTQLALKAAAQVIEAFPHAVHFVPLASLNSGDDIVSALAETVGFRFYKAEEPKQQLLDFLRQKQMLLVLDNFEHLLATGAEASHSAAVLVTEILQAAPQVKILTTSRERLNLSGETVYSLTGLAFPGQAASQAPLEFDAVKLLLQQTRLLRPNFEPQQVDFPEMIRICQLTQGMPLAIVLAAGWLEVLSLKEIADEIAQSLDFLETTMRDAPERQRSVRAAFEYSWKRLLPDEQQIFMRLSVFRGGFTRQAAQTVAEAGVRALRTLINKSLITLNQNERYEVHELLRQYAEEKLGKTDEADRIRTIHSNYYLKILHQYEAGIKGPRQLELLRGIEADLENIRSAWVWALEQKNLPAIEGALETLHLFFYIRTRLQEGILFFERAQEQLKPLPNQAVWGRILLRLSFLQSFMQAASDNKSQIEQGLLIAQRQGQEREIAFGLLTLGAHHSDAHDYATALKYFEQSLHYYRTVDDRFYLADLLLWIGHCYGQLAGLADYRVYMEQSLVLSRQAGDKTHLTIALVNLGDTALCAGEYEAAVNYCEEALTLAHEMSRRTSESEIETRLGLIAFLKGDFEQASTLVEAGLVKARDIHYTVSIVRALLMRSLQASLGGDYNLGQLLVEESLTLPVLSFELILRNWALAVAHCGLQNYEAARRSVQQALSLAQKMAYPALLTWLLPVAAVVLAQEGQKERAVTLLALAATHPLSPTGWQQQWPLLAELRRDLKAELAPEQFQVAWQRGQELDLELAVAELKAWEI